MGACALEVPEAPWGLDNFFTVGRNYSNTSKIAFPEEDRWTC